MAVLALVVLVLAMSCASSIKAYVNQRASIDAAQADIAARQAQIDDLKSQLERWNDPAYQAQQARERFGYVAPGTTPYVALGADGKRIEASSTLSDPRSVGVTTEPQPWWTGAWESMELAGNPPKTTTPKALTDTKPITVGSDNEVPGSDPSTAP